MDISVLLDRLDGVRRTGPGRWITRCPAHGDAKASLSLREADDGRILIHCFAGCATYDVIAAVGLDWSDIFPVHDGKRRRRISTIPAIDCLRAMSLECDLVAVLAIQIAHGHPLTDPERERLLIATRRIGEAAIQAGAHE